MLRNASYPKSSSSTIGSSTASHSLKRNIASPSNSNGNLPEAATLMSMSPSELAWKRQVRKDDAIRKKLDQELGRKKASTRAHGSTKPVQGTVGSLRPSQALTLLDTAMVVDAARIMAAKRADAVLVVDRDSTLVGIMTDKDLAFRVVAEGLDVRMTLISQVMTRNPFCVTTDTNATEALNKMVNGGFRHLPCLNAEGDVVGILDITKCLYEALEKLEKAHKSSKQLVEALEGMQSEWAQAANPELRSYVDIMRDKMASPDLNTILEENHGVAEIQTKTSIREASRIMKQVHATACLIMEEGRIAGILNTKDIVVRLLAAGLEPDMTSVIRVMTLHPDTIRCDMTILDALKKMHDNRYLHLPVVDEIGHMVGLVDVLQVSLAMLRQMNAIQGDNPSEGPVWNKFWESSFNRGDDTGSEMSGSAMAAPSEMIMPYGASMVGSNIRVGTVVSESGAGSIRAGGAENTLPSPTNSAAAATPTDEIGTEFVFKFKDASGQVHRFASSSRSYKELYERIVEKTRAGKEAEVMTLSYCDEENDQVLIRQDSDVTDAVSMAFRNQWPLIRLSIMTPSSLIRQSNNIHNPVIGISSSVTPISVSSTNESGVKQSSEDANKSKSASKNSGRGKLSWAFAGSIPEGLDPALVAGGVGLGVGVGIALVFALMRR